MIYQMLMADPVSMAGQDLMADPVSMAGQVSMAGRDLMADPVWTAGQDYLYLHHFSQILLKHLLLMPALRMNSCDLLHP